MTDPNATEEAQDDRHQVVVVGSGFGGLFGTKALRRADVDVTMIAKTTHHLFQPLLYQVATGILSEGEIAPPTREVLSGQKNARVLLGEVTAIDLDARTVTSHVLGRETVLPYDSLIVAAGAGQSYFGNDRFAEFAPGMKSIDDALELRGRIFGAFELAELGATRGDNVDHLLTFVVVGAGPTGVEMAGQIAELAHRTLKRDFRAINTHTARVVLIDAAPQVLPPFGAQARRLDRQEARRARGRGDARRDGHRRRRAWPRGQVQGRPGRADQRRHQGLGRRRAGQLAGPDPGPADRRAAGPLRPDRRQPRPDPAGLSRGVRGRRHDLARQPAGRRPGGDPGRRSTPPRRSTGGSRASPPRSRSSTSTRGRWRPSAASARSR